MNRKPLFNAATATALSLGMLAFGAQGWSQQQQAAPARGGQQQPPAPPTGKAPVVHVTGGSVEGAYFNPEKDVAVYRGIPFAAPPVGDLRWRAPQPLKAWSGVRDGSKYGPSCANGGAEDCLYLNVYMPAGTKPGAKLPVMFWIYGGSFTSGAGSAYDGTQFAKRGIVFVSVNYRLGRAGWFAHPAITKNNPKGEALANYGLMDDIAGLQWVQRNIGAFGGDKNNVTIFGESAGGISVNYLMTVGAPTHGLFEKAISHSSFGHLGARAMAGSEGQGKTFFDGKNITGDSTDTLAKMRALPWTELQQGASAGPINDGTLVKDSADAVFAKGEEMKIPWIVGGNSDEASFFIRDGQTPLDVRLSRITENRDAGLAAYDPTGARDPNRILHAMVTDQNITIADRDLARLHVQHGQTTYRYFFSYLPRATRATSMGVPHGGELGYTFARTGQSNQPEDFATSQSMISYWAAFAKYGDPGSAGGSDWPKYALDTEAVMDFSSSGPKATNGFLKARLDWIAANARQVTAAGAAVAGAGAPQGAPGGRGGAGRGAGGAAGGAPGGRGGRAG